MAKYKVWDKVKIVKNFSKPYEHPQIAPDMLGFQGTTATVTKVGSCTEKCCYRIKEDDEKYHWHERWFEGIDYKEIIEIKGAFAALYREKDGKRKKDTEVSLESLISKIEREKIQTPILPNGTKYYFKGNDIEIIIMEQLPQTRSVFWIDEKAKKLSSLSRKERRLFLFNLSFPYIVFVFIFWRGNILKTKVFYRNDSLTSLKNKLYHTNLQNVYCGSSEICMRTNTQGESLKRQFEIFLESFWQFSFNEDLGNDSDFCLSKKEINDKRINSVQNWQDATKKNPSFITKINWVKSEFTVENLIKGLLLSFGDKKRNIEIESENELADLMYRIGE